MRIGEDGIALIKRWESFRASPYLCPAGWWTLGYGAIHGPDGLPVTKQTLAVTEAQAELMLERDTGLAAAAVNRLCPVPLTAPNFDALCSFAFNLGAGALQRSTLRQCVLRGDHAAAAAEFPKWCKARNLKTGVYRPLPGLVARRAQEAALYVGGVFGESWPEAA
jgi:GH24 family phage-related lysozyme (muramidase)